MSEAAKLRKQFRRKRLLDCLDTANRNNMAAHIHHLDTLQQTAADLDNEGRKNLDMRFLDIRTAYRNLLGPQMRGLSEVLADEARRSEVLKRRIEDAESDIKIKEARIRDASDLDQLLDRLNRNRVTSSTASRKSIGP